MIRQQDKDAFWGVVKDCLVEIFGLARPVAASRSKKLRETVEKMPGRRHGSIFYHAEPLDVAHDLAKRDVDMSCTRERYDAILARHNWLGRTVSRLEPRLSLPRRF